ncbi:MAG: hypothetical protein NTZ26_11940 [Candidatus Aminicenantes bacterium]|nr:hypothetical protein [Candidatus Aminicenantes bacterium]
MKKTAIGGLIFLACLMLQAGLTAQAPAKTIHYGNLDYTIVDDPSPSEPSNWVVQLDDKNNVQAVRQLTNIFRTDREYEFWQGSHIIAGYGSGMSDYGWGFDCRSDDNDGWGAIIRYQDADNYYRFITVQDPGNGGPFRRLEKFVAGKRIVLDEKKEGFVLGQVYTIRIKAFGGQIDVYLDKDKILSAKDASFSKGKFGILTYANAPFSAWNLSHWTDNR